MELSVSRSRGKVARGALTAVLAASLAVMTACTSPSSDPSGSNTGEPSQTSSYSDVGNPFGVVEGSTVEIMELGSNSGLAWAEYGANLAAEKFGLDLKSIQSPDLAIDLQTRIAGGDVPDLSLSPDRKEALVDQWVTLDDVWDSVGYDGVKLSEALLPIAKTSGMVSGKFVSLPLALNQFSLYYSASLFEENGWTPPKNWDDMMVLGEKAKAAGKYLFTFGKEAATYWEWMAVDCAVKQGGLDVWRNLANLKPGAYSDPSLQACYTKIKETVDKGYWMPGGAGTQFVQAQTSWSLDQDALFYYTGSWIEGEMVDATAENFQMTAWPVPLVDPATAKMPFEAIQMDASSAQVIWKDGKNNNVAAAKEILRAIFSKEAAAELSKIAKIPSVVKGAVPADGWGSTALASIQQLAEGAGENVFPQVTAWAYNYGINPLTEWNAFLSGELTVEELTKQMQALSDAVAADSTIEKVKYQ